MNTIDFLRQFRIGEYAVFDFALTFVFAAIVGPFLSKFFAKKNIQIPLKSWFFWSVPFSIVAHLLVGSMTPMTETFIAPDGHYVLKLVMVLLIGLGFVGVKRT